MTMLKQYLSKAQKEGWALGQFNFSTMEQLRGILNAAKELKSPVILGTSENECGFLGLEEIIALVEIYKAKNKVSAFLNLDHAKNLDLIKKAIDFGYSAVHFDGSGLELKDNIKNSKKIVDYAYKKDVLVEGELGCIKGESMISRDTVEINKEELTDPKEAKKFVKETKVDSLAIAIGNIHGIHKAEPQLDFERLKEIRSKTSAYLVLHAGSGISAKDIKKAIGSGIVKININTELRLTWRESLAKMLRQNPEEIKPYKILPSVEKEIQRKVGEKIKIFGSHNRSAS